jgi:hypothetical protein
MSILDGLRVATVINEGLIGIARIQLIPNLQCFFGQFFELPDCEDTLS